MHMSLMVTTRQNTCIHLPFEKHQKNTGHTSPAQHVPLWSPVCTLSLFQTAVGCMHLPRPGASSWKEQMHTGYEL